MLPRWSTISGRSSGEDASSSTLDINDLVRRCLALLAGIVKDHRITVDTIHDRGPSAVFGATGPTHKSS